MPAGVRNSDEQLRGLAASRVREEKGKRRGDRGHFIGADAGKKQTGIEAGARISPATVSSERVTAEG
jgi:hypothetical protein